MKKYQTIGFRSWPDLPKPQPGTAVLHAEGRGSALNVLPIAGYMLAVGYLVRPSPPDAWPAVIGG
jgi:hypothetical protein